MNSSKTKIVIIGAGPAGLTAAYECITRIENADVHLFEASNAIGGISQTVNYKGNRMDIGGHRFFSKSDRVMQWWLDKMPIESNNNDTVFLQYKGQKSSISLEKNNTKADDVFLIRNRKSRIFFLRKLFDYPISLSVHTIKNLGFIRTIQIGISYIRYKCFPIKPEISLEDFFINRFGKKLYLTFFKDYTEKVWGFKCNEISKEWGAQRIKGLSITTAIKHALKKITTQKDNNIAQKKTETTLIEKFIYPKHGPGQLWELVANKISQLGGKIYFNHKAVEFLGDGVNQLFAVKFQHDKEQFTIDSDIVFSTMPIKELIGGMQFSVPHNIKHIADNLPYRDFITVGVLCENLLLTNKDQTPILDNWIYIQERDVKIGRLQVFNNWSPFMVENENHCWLGLEYFCNTGDEMWNKSDDDFKQFAIDELVKLGIVEKKYVLDSHIIRMEKTYPAYTGVYSNFTEIQEFLNQFNNLWCIGRNGMHKYNNSDHSMLTAMCAVDKILAGDFNKTDLWLINTEQEYHEE